jgi:cyclomaltodextrinase / maltogenic alpha-amylase / neopullulanase
MDGWANDAIFYHVYPLGYCGSPRRNDLSSAPEPRLERLRSDLGRIAELGFTALYLGPVFESVAHGYDPVDWRTVDRRLGTNETLRRLCDDARALGLRLVFDGVFNHTGREHPWFRELLALGERAPGSAAAARYASISPGRSPCGDPFSYEGWAGNFDLAKLDLRNPSVKADLLGAALSWIDDFGIDGIRLDTADCLDMDFLRELASACKARKADFWLMGEVVGGDYRKWAGRGAASAVGAGAFEAPGPLDSITNYECYKGLWSSQVDANYFEIAWSLKRQFGEGGIYRDIPLYSFADNHDVDRVASKLPREEQLYPLYCLLFTMPGIPSVYYGSERGARASKEPGSDWPLRPSVEAALASGAQPDLERAIRSLAALRRSSRALRRGGYRELAVAGTSMAFERSEGADRAVVAVNGGAATGMELRVGGGDRVWKDALNEGAAYRSSGGVLRIDVPKTWARVLIPG